MRNTILLMTITCSFAFALSPSNAICSTQGAKQVVETIIEKAKGLDDKNIARSNATAIESLVDFDLLTTEALGEHKGSASPSQRTEIQSLLKTILTRTVYPGAPKFFKDVKVRFTSETQDGSRTHITSSISKSGKSSTVEYWLAGSGGTFKVVDVAIEGMRWVESVRRQFSSIIEKKGVNALIDKMKKRADKLGKQI